MILRSRRKKVPGLRRITNDGLRLLSPRDITTVTRIFNGILRIGHFSQSYKLGHIILLPKPGKNILKPESYRSKSTLQPFISKIFEKLLLLYSCPTSNAVTSRDMEKAFDRGWHPGLLYKATFLQDWRFKWQLNHPSEVP